MTKRLAIIPILLVIFLILGIIFFWLQFSYFKKINTYLLVPVRITIPEGYNLEDIAAKFKVFKNFDKEIFLKTAKEGYLFPDTYFLTGRETETKIVEIMEKNFQKKVGQPEPEIIVMASLLEKESRILEERKIISGILWKRLAAGMPLQVDAELDTYRYKELPLIPICNPGLDSIEAAKNPIDSEYWYYLHDKTGSIHYAKTFSQHQKNIAKYLR